MAFLSKKPGTLSIRWAAGIGILGASALVASVPAMAAGPSYHQIASIPLPKATKSGDVVAYDPATNDVYAAWGGGGLAVVNTATNKLVTLITVPGKPNGVDFSKQYIYVASETSNTLTVIQKSNWKVVAEISTTKSDSSATTPDSVIYDPAHDQVFVTIDDNNTVQVYNGSAPFALKKTIDLNQAVPNSSIDNVGPDLASLDPSTNTFYESDGNFILAYNTATLAAVGKLDTGLKLKDANGKLVTRAGLKGSAPADNKLFIAGDGNEPTELWVTNAKLTSLIGTIPVPGSPDEMDYDAKTNTVFGFSGGLGGKGGFIMVNPTNDTLEGAVITGGHTHTGIVDPHSGDVYLLTNTPSILVYAPGQSGSAVPHATSPVTGVPTLPLAGGLSLVGLGGLALTLGRRMSGSR